MTAAGEGGTGSEKLAGGATPPAARLPTPDQVPEAVREIAARLIAAGHRAYLVGGSLRDLCRGSRPADWDLATSAAPGEVRGLFPDAIPTGERHGTMTIRRAGRAYEVTTLREDGTYTDRRRPDRVEFTAEIERDLARRDFTVNAMALDLESGRFIDPEAGGADLAQKTLRAVGDPDRRFGEDALRLLRAARFSAQLEFAVEPATRAALARQAPGLAHVAPERIQKELIALLAARLPSSGIHLLAAVGLLPHILPELAEGIGVTQNRYHRYDVFTHALFTCDEAPADRPAVRLAGLLHDVGKPRSRQVIDGEGTFYGHDKLGAEMADNALGRLRFPNVERERVVRLVRHHLFQYREDWTDAAVRRFIRRVGEEHLGDLFVLRWADARASGRLRGEPWGLRALESRIEHLLRDRVAGFPAALALDGRDVMDILGIEPGPEVGRKLAALWEAVLDDPAVNTRERLTALLLAMRE
jgi:tRNA nucleotidyltransferase (CCA-adding enzyme)